MRCKLINIKHAFVSVQMVKARVVAVDQHTIMLDPGYKYQQRFFKSELAGVPIYAPDGRRLGQFVDHLPSALAFLRVSPCAGLACCYKVCEHACRLECEHACRLASSAVLEVSGTWPEVCLWVTARCRSDGTVVLPELASTISWCCCDLQVCLRSTGWAMFST